MGLRPGRCYRWDSPAYTRTSNNPQDSYITGIPGSKIIHYNMGNQKGDFKMESSIVAKERIQVRHNALEAARTSINRKLEKTLGRMNYHFKIRVYPHHVMRENVMATGAGADRVQSGMRGSFGKPIGRAARVRGGQAILTIYTRDDERHLKLVKDVLKTGIKKLPGKLEIIVRESK
ncbi:MAG: 50S ribosomal protein L16 [Candidatus Altiarchaeales archaeon ex4484_96]|nr:MAG: 50S ribosomal protein L16 [Candidatus Altiarchaeales archaeon ex4484_96]